MTIEEAFNAAVEDTSTEAPEAPVTAPEVTGQSDTPSTPEGAGNPPVDAPAETPFNWENVPPELAPLAKGFQADYTRKMQELAEQRKQFEGIDPEHVAALKWMRETAAINPDLVRQYLIQQAEALAQPSETPVAEPDPYADLYPQTTTEEFLLQRLREQESKFSQVEQFIQQQQQLQQEQQANAAWAQLEGQVGRQLAQDEKFALLQFCQQNGLSGPKMLDNGWTLMNLNSRIADEVRKAREEASQVVGLKAGAAPAPSLLGNRVASSTEPPKDLDALVEWAAAQAGL